MRSNIVFRLFLSAALALCIGIIGQNIVLSVFSNRINATFEAAMNQLSVSIVQKNDAIFRNVEERHYNDTAAELDAQAKRQIEAVAFYAALSMEKGGAGDFSRAAGKIIEDGDYVALYVVRADGTFFSGAGRGTSPSVAARLGREAESMRTDRMATLLVEKDPAYFKVLSAPVTSPAGEEAGKALLVVAGESLARARAGMETVSTAMGDTLNREFGDGAPDRPLRRGA